MLLSGQGIPLVLQHVQGLDDPGARVGGVDNVVHEPKVCSNEGVGEPVLVVRDKFLPGLFRILGLGDLFPVNYTDRPFGAHDSDLR